MLAKGGKYEGEWDQGVRHGTGTYYYPDGVRIYRGEWKQNVRFSAHVVQSVMCVSFNVLRQLKHGRGTFTYENGDRYDGEFLNGKQVRFRPPSHAYVIAHGAISLARKGRDLDEERKCTSV